ncbi:cytochrome c [Hahella aquimaris]|uniref:c-type cytochrome n=1 Tax=Hahella sp. HNIBRBA332 TaxID=3015983 RepID=UPI00273BE0E5|nr:cytochrome c [Hahella sp. HNIBRBA332]WLQ12547.1 cytochrome c [Hahella sp. HNIBRBA332]
MTSKGSMKFVQQKRSAPLRLIKWLTLAVIVLVVAACAGFAWFVLYPNKSLPTAEPVDEYVYLDQGWEGDNASLRELYYYTPQGVSMPQGASAGAVRYNWFIHLEEPFSEQRLADPERMRLFRFIVDPVPSAANPDQLPLGFSKHLDPAIGEEVLDISCAACHSGELHYQRDGVRYAVRVDGGPAMHALTSMERGAFAPTLVASLFYTAVNPWKFDRFAQKVLSDRYPEGKDELRSALWRSVGGFVGAGQNNPLRKLYPVEEGYGRTDALGRIGNTLFGDRLSASNYQVGAAPVSYPYLWDIWKFNWVQYNGSVVQPLARNIGEALGVGARVDLVNADGSPVPPGERFHSAVRIEDLARIESALQTLKAPTWPEKIFGPVDQTLAAKGEGLFRRYCQGCHGPHEADVVDLEINAPLKPAPWSEWMISVAPLSVIGTDPSAAQAFIDKHYDLSATGLSNQDIDDALRPLLTQRLIREVRARLRQIITMRQERELPLGELQELLAAYPSNDIIPVVAPIGDFAAIAAALNNLSTPADSAPPKPSYRPHYVKSCDLLCLNKELLRLTQQGTKDIDKLLAKQDIHRLSEGLALNLIGVLVKNRYYADNNIDYAQRQCLEGFGTLDLPQEVAGYKPRPLAGVWATPPFLHNGSAPNLYQLLSPPEQRDSRFQVGYRDFDPQRVGFVTQPPQSADANGFWFDTRLPGNSNSGHAFSASVTDWRAFLRDPEANPLPKGVIGPMLTEKQRMAIIEYLKVHRDEPETPLEFKPSGCATVPEN